MCYIETYFNCAHLTLHMNYLVTACRYHFPKQVMHDSVNLRLSEMISDSNSSSWSSNFNSDFGSPLTTSTCANQMTKQFKWKKKNYNSKQSRMISELCITVSNCTPNISFFPIPWNLYNTTGACSAYATIFHFVLVLYCICIEFSY